MFAPRPGIIPTTAPMTEPIAIGLNTIATSLGRRYVFRLRASKSLRFFTPSEIMENSSGNAYRPTTRAMMFRPSISSVRPNTKRPLPVSRSRPTVLAISPRSTEIMLLSLLLVVSRLTAVRPMRHSRNTSGSEMRSANFVKGTERKISAKPPTSPPKRHANSE